MSEPESVVERVSSDSIPTGIETMSSSPYLSCQIGRCGNGNLKNIVLVTRMWNQVECQLVGCTEEELFSNSGI